MCFFKTEFHVAKIHKKTYLLDYCERNDGNCHINIQVTHLQQENNYCLRKCSTPNSMKSIPVSRSTKQPKRINIY
jgi:hypothetical protein